jgi:hypothetical protein
MKGTKTLGLVSLLLALCTLPAHSQTADSRKTFYVPRVRTDTADGEEVEVKIKFNELVDSLGTRLTGIRLETDLNRTDYLLREVKIFQKNSELTGLDARFQIRGGTGGDVKVNSRQSREPAVRARTVLDNLLALTLFDPVKGPYSAIRVTRCSPHEEAGRVVALNVALQWEQGRPGSLENLFYESAHLGKTGPPERRGGFYFIDFGSGPGQGQSSVTATLRSAEGKDLKGVCDQLTAEGAVLLLRLSSPESTEGDTHGNERAIR